LVIGHIKSFGILEGLDGFDFSETDIVRIFSHPFDDQHHFLADLIDPLGQRCVVTADWSRGIPMRIFGDKDNKEN
jgi:hypothetical protein